LNHQARSEKAAPVLFGEGDEEEKHRQGNTDQGNKPKIPLTHIPLAACISRCIKRNTPSLKLVNFEIPFKLRHFDDVVMAPFFACIDGTLRHAGKIYIIF